ncbi:hypothetical protein DEO72_LG6g1809 [Vigna unguiculata]|uniref:Uncharacterized protein n=1 Tax=Vigna unguiculata TaxID=3917 RepID=A0A4D6M6T5_VIGUN|nr:hypothetical protein DEO72_LG6g1809 [Vigna unguiculata]
MALSQRDLLRRIKQQGTTKVRTNSRTRGSPMKTNLESEPESTQSDPKLKKRKKGDLQLALEASGSNDRPVEVTTKGKEGSLGQKGGFWDEDFAHLAHGRTRNYSAADEKMLSKGNSTSVYEGLLRSLHQAEASSIFLVDRLESSEKKEMKAIGDLDVAQKEVMQLRFELDELRKTLKEKENELSTLKTEFDELTPKVQVYETQVTSLTGRCQILESEKEELADQLCSTLKQGFQLALDQVKVLCPEADISSADITKEVVDG